MGTEIDAVGEALRTVYGGRRWLVTADVLQGATGQAKQLLDHGAAGCFALGARMGTGALPELDGLEHACLDLAPADGMMEAIRAAEEALQDLPDDVQARIEAFDPAGQAQVLGPIFATGQPVAGRRFFGARPAPWRALEDKVTVDAVWDAVGVPRAPTAVVPAAPRTLAEASDRIDHGAGVVWAGDARDGFHGGASYTWWVRDEPGAERALAFLGPRCDRVRVMPFLDGIPCSIHGIVWPDQVVVLRPAEMVVLRRPEGNGFQYARASTFWDPPDADRAHMRSVARRVGEHLRATVDYRGAFTIDGVMTAQGFRPTELNPRVGAALGLMVPGTFPLLVLALIEGRVDGIDPAALEAELLEDADGRRSGSLSLLDDSDARTEQDTFSLVWSGDAWREADDGQTPDATLSVGPGPTGTYMALRLDPERTRRGPSVAPRAVALARWADAHLGTTIGPLEAAPDVRPGERAGTSQRAGTSSR